MTYLKVHASSPQTLLSKLNPSIATWTNWPFSMGIPYRSSPFRIFTGYLVGMKSSFIATRRDEWTGGIRRNVSFITLSKNGSSSSTELKSNSDESCDASPRCLRISSLSRVWMSGCWERRWRVQDIANDVVSEPAKKNVLIWSRISRSVICWSTGTLRLECTKPQDSSRSESRWRFEWCYHLLSKLSKSFPLSLSFLPS